MASFVMSAVLLFSATITYAETEQTVENGIMVTANGFIIENGVLTEYTGAAKKVEIPDEVTSIGYGAFSECSRLEKVTIPESVTSIGEGVFYGCSSNLTIYGKAGSYAEAYAKENNIPFVAVPVGDVDGDGEVTADDALDILKKKAGLIDKFKAEVGV